MSTKLIPMKHVAWLLMRGVDPAGWAYPIQCRRQTLGRAAGCEIHVHHDTVSRRHAEVWSKAGALFIGDLDSRNGTYVDGQRVAESEFSIGKALQLGGVTFEVVADLPAVAGPDEVADDISTMSQPVGKIAVASVSGVNTALLTRGQHEVLRRLLRGLSEKEVAADLFISPETVHTHVKDIYRLLNVHSRAELMALFVSPTALDLPQAAVVARNRHT